MPKNKPHATSTPTNVPRVSGRKGIRDDNSVQSPIETESQRYQYENDLSWRAPKCAYVSNSKSPGHSPQPSPRPHFERSPNRSRSFDSDSDEKSCDEEYEEQIVQTVHKNGNQWSTYFAYGLVIALIAPLTALYFSGSSEMPPQNLDQKFTSMQNEFKRQDSEFWLNIKVSIKEITVLEQPKTIIFLYENKAENTLNKILDRVSEIAVCKLTSCSNKPLEIEGHSLNTSTLIEDYGKIITKYRDSLEENGVMIVRNLEKVAGRSAQAFHSFCDDYNPIVKKALILFTMKVHSLPKEYPVRFLEKILLDLWSDIGKDDKFYPLFTRISSTILLVKPE